MRAATFTGPGGLDVIAVRDDVPEPECGPDDVLVDVAFAGLNRADLLERAGKYPIPKAAIAIPGMEFSGTVAHAGARVTNLAIGDRVCGLVRSAAMAEKLVTNALAVSKVPEDVSLRDAAAIPEAFITAYDALVSHGQFSVGKTALIHAVGSSVGLACVALVKLAGGLAIGTARTAEKLELAKQHGLEIGLPLDDGWVGKVLAATNARGVDVIVDFVGAGVLDRNIMAITTGGRIVQVGTLAGSRASIELGTLMFKRASLHGTVMRSRSLDEKIAIAKQFERELLPAFAKRHLRAEVDSVYPLEELASAHERMEENKNLGKILVILGGGE